MVTKISNKIAIIFASILAFITNTAAQGQFDPIDTFWNAIDTFVNDLFLPAINSIAEIAGIEPLTAAESLAFAAAVGIIYMFIYIVLEQGLEQIDMLDNITGSSSTYTAGGDDEGINTRIGLLSLLITVTMLGSGALAPIVGLMIAYTGLTIALGLIAIGIYVWWAGYSGVRGKGAELVGAGRSARAEGKRKYGKATEELGEAEEELAQSQSMFEKSKNLAKQIRDPEGKLNKWTKGVLGSKNVQGTVDKEELHKHAGEIEVVLQKLNNTEEQLEKGEQMMERVIKEVLDAEMSEKKEEKELDQIISNLETHITQMESMVGINSSGDRTINGDPKDFYNLSEQIKDEAVKIEVIDEDLMKKVHKNSDLEDKLEEEFEILTSDLELLQDDITKISDIEDKAEEIARKIKDRDDYERIEAEMNQTASLESRLEKMIKNKKKMHDQIEEIQDNLGQLRTHLSNANSKITNDIEPELREIQNLTSQHDFKSMFPRVDMAEQVRRNIDKAENELDKIKRATN